jgi:hypothetical protein
MLPLSTSLLRLALHLVVYLERLWSKIYLGGCTFHWASLPVKCIWLTAA